MLHLKFGVIFCLVLFCGIFWMAGNSWAEHFYITQNTSGSNTGADCTNAHSVGWLNTAGNWATPKVANKVGPGDTVHLCGTITDTVGAQVSGNSGSPITIFFEDGAKLSQLAGDLMVLSNKRYLVIDGGVNGVLENTDNGSVKTYKNATSGIYAPGASDLEIKNLTIQNLYVHTDPADSSTDLTVAAGIYRVGGNISIHDNVFHDICWVISVDGGQNINIYNNHFYNFDHGVAGLGDSTNINIYNNHFGATANWDTDNNTWHHDGIHVYFGAGGFSTGLNIYNNRFDGDWGINNTAHIFLEGDYTHANPDAVSDVKIFNNVFIVPPGGKLNNGAIGLGIKNITVVNNTFLGGKASDTDFMVGGGETSRGIIFKNNLVTSLDILVSAEGATTDLSWNHNLYANGGWNSFVWFPTDGGAAHWLGFNQFAAWKSYLGADTNSMAVDDAVVDGNGHLQVGSLAIGNGENLTSLGIAALDYDQAGVARPASGAWDIGAYEYVEFGGPTPPASPTGLGVR